MNPTSHRPELDLLRRQVADLARELAERDRVLHERTCHLQVAQALAHLGSWSWEIASGEVEWSDELYRIFGYAPRSREMTFDSFVSAVLPDDHDRVLASIDDALAGTAPYDMECRIVRPDGEVRTIHCCGEVVRESSGQPLRMSATALDITDRKETELALQQREAHFRALIEHSSDVITVLDLDGTIRFESPSVERLLGYAQYELTGRSVFEFVHHEDLPAVTEKFRLLIQLPGTPQLAEFRFRHKDGSWRNFEGIGRVIRDPDGRCSVIVNSRDITERKRVEAALEASKTRFRAIFDQTFQFIGLMKTDGTVIEANRSALQFAGIREEDVLGKLFWDTPWWTHSPELQNRLREAVRQAASGTMVRFEATHPSSTGELAYVDFSLKPVRDEHGNVTLLIPEGHNITERKRSEEDLANLNSTLERQVNDRTEALCRSEERFRQFFDNAPNVTALKDHNGRYVYTNRQFDKVLRLSPGMAIGKTDEELFSPEQAAQFRSNDQQVLLNGCGQEFEELTQQEDGPHTSIVVKFPVTDASGHLSALGVIATDITERKRTQEQLRLAEEALRIAHDELERKVIERTAELQASEERYARATAMGKVGVWEMDIENNQYYYGDVHLKSLFGYAPAEISAEPYAWLNLVYPNDRSIALNHWEQLWDGTANICHLELRMVKKDGSIVWIDVRCHGVHEQNGRLTRLIGAAVDITDRKRTEDALRESEERFAKAFRASPHPIVISELDSGRVVDANDAAYQLYGYRKEEVAGQTTLQVGLWPLAEERARFVERLKSFGSVRDMEVTLRSGDGEIRQILLSSELIELNGKQCCVTVGDDVTKSRRMERALRRTQFSVDHAVEAILWVDPTARIFNVNDTACRMLECSRQDLMAMTVHDIDPNFPVERWADHWEFLKQQGALTFEATYWSRTGAVLETEVTFNYLQYEGKEYGCMILRDVGERKRAEAERRRSHTFLRQVIDTDPDLIFAKDCEGRFAMANKAVADWYGTTVDDLIGKSDADFNANAEEVEFFRRCDLEVINSRRDQFIPEERITDAGGRTRWLQTVKRPIFDDQGRVHLVLGAATDITERKRMEEILLQRERDLSTALEERERISQDLHDGILQSLYAVGLGLEVCKPLIKKQQDRVAEKLMATLDHAIGQLNQIMTEVRNFIAGLESHVMQGGDFPTALRTMVETMSISSSARCRVRIDDAAARRLSTEQALHIINIVREGVSNALRHSRAKQITVSLRDLIRSDRLAVTDDGIGFNTSSVQGVGHGLVNMAARAQKVRGLFAIQSKLDKGTRISLDLPKDTHYAHN